MFKKKVWIIAIVAVLVVLMSFSAGCLLTLSNTPATSQPDSSLLNEAWNIIHKNYVEPDKLDDTVLNQGMIAGMVQSMDDPYSYYLTPEQYEITVGDFASSFGGIGASISYNAEGEIVIARVNEGDPAQKAGMLEGDMILAVDDVSAEGYTVDELVARVRGEVGTAVKLLVLHEGEQIPVEMTIVRAEINPESVEYRMMDDVAYIQISSFYDRTNQEFQTALENLDLSQARGIIIDLRYNLGGNSNALQEVAGHFIQDKVIVSLRDNQGNVTSLSAIPNGTMTDLPVVVLVNEYTASASESFSAAMQDYGRAVVAGTQTLGKGSYDRLYGLSDGSGIYLTIGRWLSPNGHEIEGIGVTPDIVLTETGDEAIQWAVEYLQR
jgi:carboxyl-terminal processing protease